jgi:AraC-like DNA-binding protein
VGGMTMFINPVMHLGERDRWLCEHDFDEIIRRIRKPHQSFQGDAVMAATQMMFCDFYEFHAHLYGQPEISALTASVMKRFIDLLERGDYRRNRDVAYYADKLCVTPKYLSEVSKKLSGRTAGFWIDRYATIELTRLLRDKRLSLTDISDQFGFSSQSHFSRYVQKNLGVSPSDFRQ